MDRGRILIVDDEEMVCREFARILRKQGFHVTTADTGFGGLERLSDGSYDLVMTDFAIVDMNGLEFLTRVKNQFPDIEVILVTGYVSIPTAKKAIKKGAYHYLEKPVRPDEIAQLARHAIERKRFREKVAKLEALIKGDLEEPILIGQSPRVVEALKLIKQIAKVDSNVLITGESGTGKALAASLIHYHSPRRKKPFLAITCGGHAEGMMARELFGHEKDASGGGSAAGAGLLETASGGILLLNEVGELPQSMQGELLRVIQEQQITRAGGNRPVPIDVRIISASHQDLERVVSNGLFHKDLYHQLKVATIDMPPLRDRGEDIMLLAHFFLRRFAKLFVREIKGFSEEARGLLHGYHFPGNVRELKNVIEHAVAKAPGDTIRVKDLPQKLSET